MWTGRTTYGWVATRGRSANSWAFEWRSSTRCWPGSELKLSDGTTSSIWSEHVHLAGAEAVQTFTEYPLEGVPSLTRRTVGSGAAWYLATFPDADGD